MELLRENVDREITERQEEYTKNNSMVRSLKKKLSETIEEKVSTGRHIQYFEHMHTWIMRRYVSELEHEI